VTASTLPPRLAVPGSPFSSLAGLAEDSSRRTDLALTDHTWDAADGWAATTLLTREQIPYRAALTTPLRITSADAPEWILLVEPHPAGTWDTRMRSYRARVLSTADVRQRCGVDERFLHLHAGGSLAAVSESLLRLRHRLRPERRDTVSDSHTVLAALGAPQRGPSDA
jgi:hypothetical protein